MLRYEPPSRYSVQYRWLQRCGLEWVFRLMQAPGRMANRYLVRGPRVFGLLRKTEIVPRPSPRAAVSVGPTEIAMRPVTGSMMPRSAPAVVRARRRAAVPDSQKTYSVRPIRPQPPLGVESVPAV